MARFDLYRNPGGSGLLLDVQADLMRDLNTRIVVPLMRRRDAPKPAGRLNPIFKIDDGEFVMVTQFMASVLVAELGRRTGNLGPDDATITNALDMIFSGF
jgi:toxin CcdB